MPKQKKPKPFDISLTSEQRQRLGAEIARDIEDAINARASVIADGGLIDLADWFYEQGQSDARELPFQGAADLTSYFITENVDALRARLMKAVFGVRPFCFVEGWGASAKKAPGVEAFHDWQVPKSELPFELGRTIHGALIEDGYILEVSEKVETRRITEELDVALELNADGGPIFENGQPKLRMDPVTGDPVPPQTKPHPVTGEPTPEPSARVRRTSTKTKRLGPQYDPISLKDFVFLPGHAKSQKYVYGYAYRVWPRLPELQEGVEDGVYDAEAVTALGESSDRESAQTPQPVDSVAPQYGPSVEKELWQVFLKRDLDGDGREEWYVATVSLKTRDLLRCKVDTFVQRVGRPRCVPFILFPRRNSVYGYSYAFSKLLTLAEEHTSLRNMKADRSALATNAPIMQTTGGLWDNEAQPFGIGAIITVRDHNELKQLTVQDVPPSIIESERSLHGAKERVGGLADSAVGVLSSERRTLGENQIVSAGSAVRVDEVVGHLQLAIAQVMELSHAIWVDTLRADPKGLQAPDSVANALQDRVDGFDGTFTADMLDGQFQFIPYGSDATADPNHRRQNLQNKYVALGNIVKMFPSAIPVMQSPDVAKTVIEEWCRDYDVRDRQPFLGALAAPPMPMGNQGGGPAPMGADHPLNALLAAMGGGPPMAPMGGGAGV